MKGKKSALFLLFFSCLVSVFILSRFTQADVPPMNPAEIAARFAQLEGRIQELQGEVSTLRQQIEIKGSEAVTAPAGAKAEKPWHEGLKMSGDFRLRYEALAHNEATRDRNRIRYRLRWKIEKQITKNMDVGFRFASGSSTDPTATNQTLTGDFTYKNIFIDQAYARYRPTFFSKYLPFIEKTEIAAGKTANPFLAATTSMIWDPDVTPEGIYESVGMNFLEGKVKPFANLGQFVLQENATTSDAELYGVQAGTRWSPPGFPDKAAVEFTHAFAYYDFSGYGRDSNFTVSGTSLARGNTATGTILNAGDFNIMQIYNEVLFKVAGVPTKFFGDFAMNLADHAPDPDGRNVGYEYGVKVGSAKKKGDWEGTFYYAYIEPNAVVGAFSESDFGNGFADKLGVATQLKYQMTDSLRLGFNAFFVSNVVAAKDETRRFSADMEWLF